jgi:hypothetical protein
MEEVSSKETLVSLLIICDELIDQLNTMHRGIDQMAASQREIHRRYASKASKPVNFVVGDYVLVAIPDTPKQLKLTITSLC